jgi:hypothetical protein
MEYHRYQELPMARKAKDNKEHYSERSQWTSTKTKKRPSKERGPFGENMGTVQKRNQKTKTD